MLIQFNSVYSTVQFQFQLAQQCIQTSARINSSSVHTYIFVCFTLRVILRGFVTQNATWCQNRGCICISSTRRTYGRIHSSFLHTPMIRHPDKNNNSVDRIISKEEERFFNLSSSTEYSSVSTNNTHPTRTTRFLQIQCILQCFQVILHTELILPQEILQLQGSSRAGSLQQLFPVSPSILHGRIRLQGFPTVSQGHTAQAGFQ